MANFDQLKQSVAALIRTNGAEEITGQIMQDVLLTIINSISGGYMFGGVAQHSGNVGNPDYNVFYLAGSGAYTGYGDAINIPNGCYGVFRYNGSWTQDVVDIGVHLTGTIREGETNGVTGDVINTALQQLFNNVMNILDTLTFTYNTPSAQQATKAMLDVIVTPTGGASHVLTTLTLASATAAAAGLMSAEDKQKVDRMLTDFRSLSFSDTTAVADQATKIVQTLYATLGENPEAITTMTFLAATASKAGLLSAADKAKLDALWSSGYQFAGIATPSTTPISTTSKIFYIATEAGTYFNAVTVTQGINIIYKSGDSWSVAQVVGIDNEPTAGSDNLVSSEAVFNFIYPDKDKARDKAIQSDGTIATINNDAFSVSGFYYAEAGVKIVNGRTSTASIIQKAAVAFYDEHFQLIPNSVKAADNTTFTMELADADIPTGAVYLRANIDSSTGYVDGRSARKELEEKTNTECLVLSFAYPYNLDIEGYSPETTVSDVTIPNQAIRIKSVGTVYLYLNKGKSDFYGSARPVRIKSTDDPIVVNPDYFLFFKLTWSSDSSVYSTLVTSSSQLHITEPWKYVLLGRNVYGRLTNGLLLEALTGRNMYDLSCNFSFYNTRVGGFINNSGVLKDSDTYYATPYYYALSGSYIYNAVQSSGLNKVFFYDKDFNFISYIEAATQQFLNGTNIPSNAIYFRTNISPSIGYVNGMVADVEGLAKDSHDMAKKLWGIYSYFIAHRDYLPEITDGSTYESVKITYPALAKAFLSYKGGTSVLPATPSIQFPAGDINIPRYGVMYVDLRNELRVTVQSSDVVIDSTSEDYREDTDGTPYMLINSVAYYQQLPTDDADKFIFLVKNGAGILLYGPYLECLTDARLRGLESASGSGGESEMGSIFNLNPASEYSGRMVNAKARRYDRVNAQYKEYPISLLWFSDLHADMGGITNLKRLLSWKDKYSAYIDDVISTGDQQNLYYTDDFSYWDVSGATDVLQVIGNHDAWISKAMYQTGDYDNIVERGYGSYDPETGLYSFYIIKQKNVYDKFFKDRISRWNVTQPANAESLGKNYYYKDYNNRIRLIVLDAKHYGSPDDLDGNNQSIQDAWFTSVLADARTNNMEVVAVSHYYPRLITQNRCSWNYNYWGGNGDDKLNSLATTAVTNFINAGGTFICWMVGHTHYDDIGLITTDNNQLVIGCSTANNTRSTAFVRPTGTKLQDSFNIISFDTSDGKVNILKVGGDTNNNFTSRRVLSYQYKIVTDEFGVEHQKGLILSE